MEAEWTVHKFGGTSVGSPEAMLKCFKIIKPLCDNPQERRIAIVVSAMGGKPKVTDLLLNMVRAAAEGMK